MDKLGILHEDEAGEMEEEEETNDDKEEAESFEDSLNIMKNLGEDEAGWLNDSSLNMEGGVGPNLITDDEGDNEEKEEDEEDEEDKKVDLLCSVIHNYFH